MSENGVGFYVKRSVIQNKLNKSICYVHSDIGRSLSSFRTIEGYAVKTTVAINVCNNYN